MSANIVKIISVENATHNVLCIRTEKPPGYAYTPGQATEVSINQPGWQEELRPFTFTGLPTDDHLEFCIKIYPEDHGVTEQLLQVKPGDELILHDVFGAIAYKGPGVFIAGGAGITPFLSILRDLETRHELGKNKLIFANKTSQDIILDKELHELLGSNFINILSNETNVNYAHGRIDAAFLTENVSDFEQKFYVCGPPAMMEAVESSLKQLGVSDSDLIKEEF